MWYWECDSARKSMLNNVQRLTRCLLVFVLNLPYRRIPLMEFLDVVQFHRLFLNCHWHSSTEVFIRARKVEMSFKIGLDLQKSAVLWKKTRTTAFSYTRYLGLVAMTSRVTCALMIKGSICFSNLLSQVVWGLLNRGFLWCHTFSYSACMLLTTKSQ